MKDLEGFCWRARTTLPQYSVPSLPDLSYSSLRGARASAADSSPRFLIWGISTSENSIPDAWRCFEGRGSTQQHVICRARLQMTHSSLLSLPQRHDRAPGILILECMLQKLEMSQQSYKISAFEPQKMEKYCVEGLWHLPRNLESYFEPGAWHGAVEEIFGCLLRDH